MSFKFTILGCGNSSGVPVAGNYWGACNPSESKNRRNRCSAAVSSDTTTLIIDTGSDFRHQMTEFEIMEISAVLYSHQHSDHISGIDDLRPYFFRNNKTPAKCYGKYEVIEEIRARFSYLFDGGRDINLYPPIVEGHSFKDSDYNHPQQCGDITYIPFLIDHGTCQSVGYRFGDISYCVDMKSLDETALSVLKGTKIWIVDGAGYQSADNPVHANLESLYAYNEIVNAEEVYITCLTPHMDYKRLTEELPEGFYPAYDGLQFTSEA